MKKCTKCGIEKDLTCYGKNGNRLRSDCKDCQAIRKSKWYYENGGQEKSAVTNKKWYYENRLNNPNALLLKGARDRAKEWVFGRNLKLVNKKNSNNKS